MGMFDGEQFGRSFVLEVGDIQVQSIGIGQESTLPVEFRIERDDSPVPNQASIKIFNLAPATRDRLEQQGEVTCRLQAGYKSNYAQIFYGVLTHIDIYREAQNWVTLLEIGDGQDKLTSPRINRTFSKGTKYADVFRGFAKAMRVPLGNTDALDEAKVTAGGRELERAYTATGDITHELTRLCRSLGLLWFLHDGELHVYDGQKPLGDTQSVLKATDRPRVDPKTGIITVVSRLIPEVIPGYIATLESSTISGPFLVKSTRHYGFTHGGDWSLEAELLPRG